MKTTFEFSRRIANKTLGLGFIAGTNHLCNGRPLNFFIEYEILLWQGVAEWDWSGSNPRWIGSRRNQQKGDESSFIEI
jgi:hypothetical protein